MPSRADIASCSLRNYYSSAKRILLDLLCRYDLVDGFLLVVVVEPCMSSMHEDLGLGACVTD